MYRSIHETHFGAAKSQISINTGVYHLSGYKKPFSFSSVSDLLDHGPAGIFAHLKPVLLNIKEKFPYVKTLEMWSDGPRTQYR